MESSTLRLACIQSHVSGNKTRDVETVRRWVRKAVKARAEVVVLPECFSCPYDVKKFREFAESVENGPSILMLKEEAQRGRIWIIGGSIPELDSSENRIYNTCCVLSPEGELVAKHRKVHLFNVNLAPSKITNTPGIKFNENETLSPGNNFTSIETPKGRIAVGICFDLRFPEYSLLATRNTTPATNLLVFPGAFNLTTGPLHWHLLLRSRAVDCQVFVAAAAPCRGDEGNGSGYVSFAHSVIIDPFGQVLEDAGEEEGMIISDCDLSLVNSARKAIPISTERRNDLYCLTKNSKE